ncbi:MAG: DotG/IcmE/VirB10 family protein [Alphaproteobacteria bacterium]|nr:DotG/IcmE/VirB10 family protein [Alphaproteobacteria bacterium]
MSDNLDDDLNLDNTFDDFDRKKSSLGELWKENPLVKVGIIAGVVILIFSAMAFFGGKKQIVDPSYVGEASEINAPPGTQEASQAYVKAIEEADEAAVELAYREGTSALPVPVQPPVGVISVPNQDPNAEDPLQRWRRLQEERLQREMEQSATLAPETEEQNAAQAEAVAALSEAMAQQMSSILETRGQILISSKVLTPPDFLKKLNEDKLDAQNNAIDNVISGNESVGEVLLPAAQIVYAQLLTEANTDAPGPVLAQIVSGPLKGSRILGTFEEKEELLTLNFDTVVVDGESISIDAVALDPKTTLPAMATEVDHRYFKRVILPAAAAFVQGMASAVAESGRTSVTIQGETVAESTDEASNEQEVATGIQEAGEELQTILTEMADKTKVMVKIHAGTPLGILFLEPVVKPVETQEKEESAGAFTMPAVTALPTSGAFKHKTK